MKEVVALVVIYLVFFICSIILYQKAFYVNKKWLYLLIPAYLLVIYLYFEFINYIHFILREKGFYFEFGHASIWLIISMLLAYLTAIVLVTIFFIRSRKRSSHKQQYK